MGGRLPYTREKDKEDCNFKKIRKDLAFWKKTIGWIQSVPGSRQVLLSGRTAWGIARTGTDHHMISRVKKPSRQTSNGGQTFLRRGDKVRRRRRREMAFVRICSEAVAEV